MKKRRLFILALVAAPFITAPGCVSSYAYQHPSRMTCAGNLATIAYATDVARDFENASGQDVDAYSQSDRDWLTTSLAIAGFQALIGGRVPDADDACRGLNNAAHHVYEEYRYD